MIEIKHPFSLWLQISSLSFFLAGNFSDLLIIRICLSSAYVFLFLNSALGAPLWPKLFIPQHIQLDGVIWACLNLYVHITTVVRLLRDEWPVDKLHKNPDMLALWRMFYRTGGLSQRVFQKTVADYCTVVTHDHGETIDTDRYFYIIYEGTVKLTVTDDNGSIVSSRRAQSGQLFDFRALGLLQDHQSLAKHRLEAVVAISSRVKFFRFDRDEITRIASHPSTRLMWKEILMENLLRIVQRYFDRRVRHDEDDLHKNSIEYKNPIFLPLADWEQPHPLRAGSGRALESPISHIWASMQWSFAPPWPWKGPPMGLRHRSLLVGTSNRQEEMGRVQGIPPRKVLDTSDESIASDNSSTSSLLLLHHDSTSNLSSANNSYYTAGAVSVEGEEEEFLEYLHEIDEEMGGMHLIGFNKAVPSYNSIPE